MNPHLKITYRENVSLINNIAEALALIERKRVQPASSAVTPAPASEQSETKWEYALRRLLKRAQKLHQKFQEKQEELNIENSLSDKTTGKILRNERGGYEFDKAGLKALNGACSNLLDSEVEIEPYFCTEVPPNLSQTERDNFMGFLIEGQREE